AAAIAPWWVLHATNLGQVAPLVATGAVLATRFARDGNDIAAGLALSLLYLKPNTAFLVPLALLAAGRYRLFAVCAAAGLLHAPPRGSVGTRGLRGVGAYRWPRAGSSPPLTSTAPALRCG